MFAVCLILFACLIQIIRALILYFLYLILFFFKVKSIKLDIWEPEVLKVMAELGNTIVNQIFERKTDVGNHVKPGPDATRSQREAWIIAKYKDKAFVDKDIFTSSGMESGAALCVSRLRRRARPPKKSEKKAGQLIIQDKVY